MSLGMILLFSGSALILIALILMIIYLKRSWQISFEQFERKYAYKVQLNPADIIQEKQRADIAERLGITQENQSIQTDNVTEKLI